MDELDINLDKIQSGYSSIKTNFLGYRFNVEKIVTPKVMGDPFREHPMKPKPACGYSLTDLVDSETLEKFGEDFSLLKWDLTNRVTASLPNDVREEMRRTSRVANYLSDAVIITGKPAAKDSIAAAVLIEDKTTSTVGNNLLKCKLVS